MKIQKALISPWLKQGVLRACVIKFYAYLLYSFSLNISIISISHSVLSVYCTECETSTEYYSTKASFAPWVATSGKNVPKFATGINKLYPSKLLKRARISSFSINTYSLLSALCELLGNKLPSFLLQPPLLG